MQIVDDLKNLGCILGLLFLTGCAIVVFYGATMFYSSPRYITAEQAGIQLPKSVAEYECVLFPYPGGDQEYYLAAPMSLTEFHELVKQLPRAEKSTLGEQPNIFAWNSGRPAHMWKVTLPENEETYRAESLEGRSTVYLYLKYENGVAYYRKQVR